MAVDDRSRTSVNDHRDQDATSRYVGLERRELRFGELGEELVRLRGQHRNLARLHAQVSPPASLAHRSRSALVGCAA